ncbi:LysR substrate-binding domain-containing protein, partial [Ideonella sp.]|uniref:LysR substrate-binding domain-containing protein n=1 Tax=Ideonella sp. TaxID=1929293 RepID=UPI003BB4DA46
RLRISAPPTFSRLILMPALPAYAQAHPEVELELVLSVPFLDQGSGDADLHVRHGTALAGPADLLMQDWLLPLASPALLGSAGLRQPADLARLPLLRTPVEPWAPWFDAAGLDWPEPEQGHRLIDLGLTLEAALCGQGVALARPSLARLALREGRLLPALGHGSTPLARAASGYYLLPHAGSTIPGPAADCARWLQQACRDAAAEGLALVSGGA